MGAIGVVIEIQHVQNTPGVQLEIRELAHVRLALLACLRVGAPSASSSSIAQALKFLYNNHALRLCLKGTILLYLSRSRRPPG